ncbi:hypothetical protein C0991_000558 [Blastosporella zonata]|nr:hypothetical protein C0991_000558 [Blastosporella zonata]
MICYDRATQKVYSSYHVQFIESHNNYTIQKMADTPSIELTEPVSDFTDMDAIARASEELPKTTTNPDDDKTSPIIVNDTPDTPQIPQIPAIIPPPTVKPIPEVQTQRSTRMMEKVACRDQETRLEKAVRESKESGECIQEGKETHHIGIRQE